MSDFRSYYKKQMQDQAFLAEQENTRAEFDVTRALIAAGTLSAEC